MLNGTREYKGKYNYCNLVISCKQKIEDLHLLNCIGSSEENRQSWRGDYIICGKFKKNK